MNQIDYEPRSPSGHEDARAKLPFVVGQMGLAVWPCCLLPNIMSFAGHRDPSASLTWGERLFVGFLWGSTAYPAVWLALILLYFLFKTLSVPRAARAVAWLPRMYLAILLILVLGAWVGERS